MKTEEIKSYIDSRRCDQPSFWASIPPEICPPGSIAGKECDQRHNPVSYSRMFDVDQCTELVNFYHRLRMHFSEYTRFDRNQVIECMGIEHEWGFLDEYLFNVADQMRRGAYYGEQWIGMHRSPPPIDFELRQWSESKQGDTRYWVALNRPDSGGQIFFPEQRLVYQLKEGEGLSVPAEWPWGIAPWPSGQYLFTVSGLSRALERDEIKGRWQ